MVPEKEDPPAVAHLFLERERQGKPVVQPQRHGAHETPERARPGSDMPGQHAGELKKRLFVKNHAVQVVRRDVSRLQAVVYSGQREIGRVLPAREALFLRRRGYFSALHQAGGRIMIVGRNAENVHQSATRREQDSSILRLFRPTAAAVNLVYFHSAPPAYVYPHRHQNHFPLQ